ncbi:MAG: LAGLIDADG family homing endonuclease [Candidatus Thorarchaeota archaeon]|nr:LAGLIDADG family homing endonuclease [Candidatus Thorarchaeota archaeon]
MDRTEAFMYLLGLILSDGTIEHSRPYSASLKFKASSAYSWGLQLGELYRLFLAQFGLSCSYRLEDSSYDPDHDPPHVWSSTSTSLAVWIEHVLFGLPMTSADVKFGLTDEQKRRPQTKTYIPIDAEWLFDLPDTWVDKFIQGLADGDGSVSLENTRCTITSLANQDLIQHVLARLGVKARVHGIYIVTSGNEDVIKASTIPFFWGTTAKREKLTMLVEWLKKPPPQKWYTPAELEVLSEAIDMGWPIEKINNTIYEVTSQKHNGEGWYRAPRGLIRKMSKMRRARSDLLREVLKEAQQRHWSTKMVIRAVRTCSKARLGYIWKPRENDIEREIRFMTEESNDPD